MFIVTSTDVWADTQGVQRAITLLHGRHLGSGNFIVEVATGAVAFLRRDSDKDGKAMKEQYSLLGRPYILDGKSESVSTVILVLERDGHTVVYKEE